MTALDIAFFNRSGLNVWDYYHISYIIIDIDFVSFLIWFFAELQYFLIVSVCLLRKKQHLTSHQQFSAEVPNFYLFLFLPQNKY